MTKIIVPIDFSEESIKSLELAKMLANKMKAKIEMVHVITDINETSSSSLKEEHSQVEKNFQEIIKKNSGNGNNNIDLSYIIREGKVYLEVINQASSFEDSLIVMSTHGKSGFDEFFAGSNAYKIASISKSPVISTQKRTVSNAIKKIVMPLNRTFQTREKVPYTLKLAKLFGAEIHIVTVNSTNEERVEERLNQYAEQVGAFLNTHEVSFKIEHLSGSNLTDIVIDYANSINADLISIMLEQEKSISNLFIGSYAHQMINKSSIPVLTFPNYEILINDGSFKTQGIYY